MWRSKLLSCVGVELALLGIPQIVRVWTANEHWMIVLLIAAVQIVLYGVAEVQLVARSIVDGLCMLARILMSYAGFFVLYGCAFVPTEYGV